MTSRFFVFVGFCLALATVGTYVAFQAREISAAPSLVVVTPLEGEKTDSSHIRVTGTTAPDATVTVNGQKAFVESTGAFMLFIDVPHGVSTLTIEARRRYSRATSIERHVMFERAP